MKSPLTWWLSFAGEGKFNGLVLLEATSTDETLETAVARVKALGISPGGEVMGLTVTPDMEPTIDLLPRNTLIDEESLRRLGHRRLRELEEEGLVPIPGSYDLLCEQHAQQPGDAKMTVHPAVELALELVRESAKKAGFSVPPWLGQNVLGPRVHPGTQKRMPQQLTVASKSTIGPIHLTGGSWVGLSHTASEGPLDDSLLTDSILDHHLLWASRTYEVRNRNYWDHVLVMDIEREHGDYLNLCSGDPGVTCKAWTGCAFLGIGGQAVQTVQRGLEAASRDSMGEGGRLVHDYGLIRDAGRNRLWGRASFAISHHARQWNKIEDGVFKGFEAPVEEPYQNDIVLRRQVIDLSGQSSCRGLLLAQGKRRRVRLEECLLLASTLEQPMGLLDGIDRLEVAGCMAHARGGQAWLSLAGDGEVVTDGNIGNIEVHRDGLEDGPLSKTR